jgi:hypothetical protein
MASATLHESRQGGIPMAAGAVMTDAVRIGFGMATVEKSSLEPMGAAF